MIRKPGHLDKVPLFAPPTEAASIWRYIDFAKYVSMLDLSCLILPNSLLFNDPFEGSWPKKVAELTESFTKQAFESLNASALAQDPENQKYIPPVEKTLEQFKKTRSFGRGYTYISCWHMSENESDAMWKLYGKAIAIRSTYSKLDQEVAAAINESNADFASIGAVKYIDFENESDLLFSLDPNRNFIKRNHFVHEKEVRVVVTKITGKTIFKTLPLKVRLNNLIDIVRVNPDEDKQFTRLVESITRKYDYGFKVEQSEMNRPPIF